MPTATHRLRVRRVKTVGFVDKGDDPDAEVVFFKRSDHSETFDEVGNSERIDREIFDLTHRMSRALMSALHDTEGTQSPLDVINTSLDQFMATVRARATMWVQGKPVEKLTKRIIQRGQKFIVMSEDNTVLGTHDTKEEADAQLRAAEAKKGAGHRMEKNKLGSMVQRAREAKGMTQEALATKIGVTAGTVGAIESGEISVPPRVRLRRIASALGITLSGLEAAASDKDRLDRPPPPNVGKMMKFLRALGLRVGMANDEVEKLLADGATGSDNDDGTATGGDMPFDIEKLGDEERAEFEKLQGELAEAATKIETLEKGDGDGDAIDTKDLPEPVAKALKDLEKRTEEAENRAKVAEEDVAKLVDASERDRFIAKAKTLGLVPDDHAAMLRKIAGVLDDDELKKFEETIQSLSKQAAEGGLYGEVGVSGQISGDQAESEVAELTKKYRDDNPGTPEELARGNVMKNRPDLRRALEVREQASRSAEG